MRLSPTYDEFQKITVVPDSTLQYSVTDSFANLFYNNASVDKSIIFTKSMCPELREVHLLPTVESARTFGNVFRSEFQQSYPNNRYIHNFTMRQDIDPEPFTFAVAMAWQDRDPNYWFGYVGTKNIGTVPRYTYFVRNLNLREFILCPTIRGYTVDEITEFIRTKGLDSDGKPLPLPSEKVIPFNEFAENYHLYYVTSVTMSYTYVWRQTTNGKWGWRGTVSLKPVLINIEERSGGVLAPFSSIRGEALSNLSPRTYRVDTNSATTPPSTTGGSGSYIYEMLDTKVMFSLDDFSNLKVEFPPIPLYSQEDTYCDLGWEIVCDTNTALTLAHYDIRVNDPASSYPTLQSATARLHTLHYGEFIKKLLASLGTYFVGGEMVFPDGITPDTLLQNENVWLGEMNGAGYTTGNLIRGKEITKDYPGWNITGTTVNPDFDPDKEPEPDLADNLAKPIEFIVPVPDYCENVLVPDCEFNVKVRDYIEIIRGDII